MNAKPHVVILGSGFAGHLVSDRWSAYSWLPDGRRQLCWAHLRRAFRALVDRGGKTKPLGAAALRLIDELLEMLGPFV